MIGLLTIYFTGGIIDFLI